MLTRREALSAVAAPLVPAASSRPNILFILIDDLRFNALGITGHPFMKTPHIDRIGREGAVFGRAFVTTPLCSPSRASFLTGRYVHAHGVTGNGDNAALSHQLVTFPRLLKDAGYETAYVGKWHMGNDDTPRSGFDRWVSFRGQGVYIDPPVNVDGKLVKASGYMTDILTDHAVEFISRSRQKPFCLYLAHKAIHGPFTPAARHKDLYSTEPVQRHPNAADTLEGKPAMTRQVDGQPAVKPGGGSPDELIRNQLRCLAAIDDGVGRILKALEETKQLDNTLVIFTSDNGYFWGDHGLGDKRWAYEESIRIPMLARYPKWIKAGSKFGGMALNIDIAPTALDAAGVKIPASIHGRSLVPLMQGRARNWRTSFVAEYYAEKNYPRTPTWHGVRNERWKYVRYDELQGMDELYDLKSDPYEMKNLIEDPSFKATLESLKKELDRLLKETSA
jgi:N-acetylglucosamine-6-sulfatase